MQTTSTIVRGRRGIRVAATASLALAIVAVPSAYAHDSRMAASWQLNEDHGQQTRDHSGHRNHGMRGSTAGADANDPDWVRFGTQRGRQVALRFDGNDVVTVPDSATLEPGAISISARLRAPASPGTYRYVASKGAIRCETASYGLYTAGSGGLAFYVSDGSHYTLSPDAGSAVWDGRWHDVLGTFDGDTVRLYVDGAEVESGSPSAVSIAYGLSADDNFSIGDYAGQCADRLGFVGDIDAIAVADQALVPDQADPEGHEQG